MLNRDDGQEVRVQSLMFHVRGGIIPARNEKSN